MQLTIRSIDPEPVITIDHPDADGIRHGFEGGRAFRLNGTTHLFTAEVYGEPRLVKMRLGHWTSADGRSFRRAGTLRESSGDFTGADERAALWSPMPIFDEATDRWRLFYVAYRAKPNTETAWYNNYDGRVVMSASRVPGLAGVGGPYDDIDVILQPGELSQPWEGLQGVDSFFPYRVKDGWIGLYGSAQTQTVPCTFWGVGMSLAPTLAGPWVRKPEGNPIKFDLVFAENPVVVQLSDGTYVAMLDGLDRLGYASSIDGITWTQATFFDLKGRSGWWKMLRTPVSLIELDDGGLCVYFTGTRAGNESTYCVGRLDVIRA